MTGGGGGGGVAADPHPARASAAAASPAARSSVLLRIAIFVMRMGRSAVRAGFMRTVTFRPRDRGGPRRDRVAAQIRVFRRGRQPLTMRVTGHGFVPGHTSITG